MFQFNLGDLFIGGCLLVVLVLGASSILGGVI